MHDNDMYDDRIKITVSLLRKIAKDLLADHTERDTNFANSGSALRTSTSRNPRNQPCPTCGEPNRLTPKDVRLGYQCDGCANASEGGVAILVFEL